ncbi:MAG: hypothetical protein FWG20_06330, partial [Candidatus Cloacimonetes bacterium]|nr:hypothetical protein [Candidatus Cloacimonadota bacterium]
MHREIFQKDEKDMTWFLCIISSKPFLEWEIEKFISLHPDTSHTYIKNSFYIAYDSKPELILKKKPDEQDDFYSAILGRGYISKSTGYSV